MNGEDCKETDKKARSGIGQTQKNENNRADVAGRVRLSVSVERSAENVRKTEKNVTREESPSCDDSFTATCVTAN